jgi:hypothetical protein
VPARADHRAVPDWQVVARNGRYDWHDHRIHWMSEGNLPPQVEDEAERAKVFDWRIPLDVARRPVTISGSLTWLGIDEGGLPIAAALSLLGALAGGAALVLTVRRRRTRKPAGEAW